MPATLSPGERDRAPADARLRPPGQVVTRTRVRGHTSTMVAAHRDSGPKDRTPWVQARAFPDLGLGGPWSFGTRLDPACTLIAGTTLVPWDGDRVAGPGPVPSWSRCPSYRRPRHRERPHPEGHMPVAARLYQSPGADRLAPPPAGRADGGGPGRRDHVGRAPTRSPTGWGHHPVGHRHRTTSPHASPRCVPSAGRHRAAGDDRRRGWDCSEDGQPRRPVRPLASWARL